MADPEELARLKQAAREYLEWLNSDKPLDDTFARLKGRIVTLACGLLPVDVLREAPVLSGSISPQEEEQKKD